jgi:hypothetical protein
MKRHHRPLFLSLMVTFRQLTGLAILSKVPRVSWEMIDLYRSKSLVSLDNDIKNTVYSFV